MKGTAMSPQQRVKPYPDQMDGAAPTACSRFAGPTHYQFILFNLNLTEYILSSFLHLFPARASSASDTIIYVFYAD